MSASKEMARKAGLSTSGEREAVRLVGPRQPMTKRGFSGVLAVNARAAPAAISAAALLIS